MLDETQVGLLLAKISLYDNRAVIDPVVIAWQEALDPKISIQDAKQAVIDFYGDPRWAEGTRRPWIMPADVNARVFRMRRDRMLSVAGAQLLSLDRMPSNPDLAESTRRLMRLTADGLSVEAALAQVSREMGVRLLEAPVPRQAERPKIDVSHVGRRMPNIA